MEWSPRATRQDPPEERQRVFYFFEPSGHWFYGEWNAEDKVFSGPGGFCDDHDAPYWHPEPPSPCGEIKTRPADESKLSPKDLRDICVSSEWTVFAEASDQEFLPDCMMPDGAQPCKGYLQLQEAAIQIAQDKHEALSVNAELYDALAQFVDAVECDVIRVLSSERDQLITILSDANSALAKARPKP